MNYIDIVNDVSAPIMFTVTYVEKGQAFEDYTSYFIQNVIKRIYIPLDATSIKVTVWVFISSSRKKQIFTDSFRKSEQRCYIAQGTTSSATCKRVDCSSIPTNNLIYTLNKSDSSIYLEAIYIVGKEGFKDITSPILVGKGASLLVPRTAVKLQFKIYMLDKSASNESWDVIYTNSYSDPFKICLEVSGTLKKPVTKRVPCSLGDGNGSTSPNCCCCCCCNCCCKSLKGN